MSAVGNGQGEGEIEVKPFHSWHIANYNGLKSAGTTRTEAIAHLLLTLRCEIEVVSIRVKPIPKRVKHG